MLRSILKKQLNCARTHAQGEGDAGTSEPFETGACDLILYQNFHVDYDRFRLRHPLPPARTHCTTSPTCIATIASTADLIEGVSIST